MIDIDRFTGSSPLIITPSFLLTDYLRHLPPLQYNSLIPPPTSSLPVTISEDGGRCMPVCRADSHAAMMLPARNAIRHLRRRRFRYFIAAAADMRAAFLPRRRHTFVLRRCHRAYAFADAAAATPRYIAPYIDFDFLLQSPSYFHLHTPRYYYAMPSCRHEILLRFHITDAAFAIPPATCH